MRGDQVIQAAILLLSGLAFVMLQSSRRQVQRLASAIGVAAQAFWLVATSTAHQWGMLALSLVYLGVYIRKLWTLRAPPPVLPPESYWRYRQRLPH